jgi:hypothetical protein
MRVVQLGDVARDETFFTCRAIQGVWVVQARDGSLKLSFARPPGAKAFVLKSLEDIEVELLVIDTAGDEFRVHASLKDVAQVSISVPGLDCLDETRIQGTLVLRDAREGDRLWFEASEGDASNVARIVLVMPEGERLAWANARFPSVAVAPPPPSRRCM